MNKKLILLASMMLLSSVSFAKDSEEVLESKTTTVTTVSKTYKKIVYMGLKVQTKYRSQLVGPSSGRFLIDRMADEFCASKGFDRSSVKGTTVEYNSIVGRTVPFLKGGEIQDRFIPFNAEDLFGSLRLRNAKRMLRVDQAACIEHKLRVGKVESITCEKEI